MSVKFADTYTKEYITLGSGGYGSVVHFIGEPNIVHKIYSNRDTFEDEHIGYQNALKLIENEIPDLKEHFAQYLGTGTQTKFANYYSKTLRFKRYSGDVYSLIKRDITSRTKILKALQKILYILTQMDSRGICHNDFKDRNIFYEYDEEGNLQLVIGDYSQLGHQHSLFSVNYLIGKQFYYPYSPIINYLAIFYSNNYQTIKKNDYNLDSMRLLFKQHAKIRSKEAKYSFEMLRKYFTHLPRGETLLIQKYYLDYKGLNCYSGEFELFNNKFRQLCSSGIKKSKLIKKMLSGNDLYGFATILLTLIRYHKLDHDTELCKLTFDMMNFDNIFDKNKMEYYERLCELNQ